MEDLTIDLNFENAEFTNIGTFFENNGLCISKVSLKKEVPMDKQGNINFENASGYLLDLLNESKKQGSETLRVVNVLMEESDSDEEVEFVGPFINYKTEPATTNFTELPCTDDKMVNFEAIKSLLKSGSTGKKYKTHLRKFMELVDENRSKNIQVV